MERKIAKIAPIKDSYNLSGKEIHTGWMMRRYLEQERISNFENLDYDARRAEVYKERGKTLNKLAILGDKKKVRNTKKAYTKTKDYIHLTLEQRKNCVQELADIVGTWDDSRLFAEATDLKLFNLSISVFENAFTNVISRFDTFVDNYSRRTKTDLHGLVIQDQNESQSLRLTELMKKFHSIGTMWTQQTRIIETPLFVDSRLTGMIQMADVCAYATRRFFEYNETDLFNRIYHRFDRIPAGSVVGIRHYTGVFNCKCRVCLDH